MSTPSHPIALVILGATATGKTEVALRLARLLDGEIIGADSVQVYRGLEAGSCKPPAAARAAVPHHLIDVADPHEAFSAGRFAREAAAAVDEIKARGKTPIVAGGTGLYLRALLRGIAPLPPRDEAVRRRLYARAEAESREALHDSLAQVDPAAAARLGRRDLQRVVRALEVFELTGRPLSAHFHAQGGTSGGLPALTFGLTMARERLYERINSRVEAIVAAGIVEEVRALLAGGLDPASSSMKALAYREVVAHLRGDYDEARCIELVRRNTRHYARRQLIWFGREPDVIWFDVGAGSPQDLDAIAAQAAYRWRAAR